MFRECLRVSEHWVTSAANCNGYGNRAKLLTLEPNNQFGNLCASDSHANARSSPFDAGKPILEDGERFLGTHERDCKFDKCKFPSQSFTEHRTLGLTSDIVPGRNCSIEFSVEANVCSDWVASLLYDEWVVGGQTTASGRQCQHFSSLEAVRRRTSEG